MPRLIRLIVTVSLVLFAAGSVVGRDYFVDQKHPQADDRNPGTEDKPFKTIQPAVDAAVPIQPVALRYFTPTGATCDAAAYYGDMSFGQSLMRIARLEGLIVEVRFLPVIDPAGLDRRDLARRAEAAVRQGLGNRS